VAERLHPRVGRQGQRGRRGAIPAVRRPALRELLARHAGLVRHGPPERRRVRARDRQRHHQHRRHAGQRQPVVQRRGRKPEQRHRPHTRRGPAWDGCALCRGSVGGRGQQHVHRTERPGLHEPVRGQRHEPCGVARDAQLQRERDAEPAQRVRELGPVRERSEHGLRWPRRSRRHPEHPGQRERHARQRVHRGPGRVQQRHEPIRGACEHHGRVRRPAAERPATGRSAARPDRRTVRLDRHATGTARAGRSQAAGRARPGRAADGHHRLGPAQRDRPAAAGSGAEEPRLRLPELAERGELPALDARLDEPDHPRPAGVVHDLGQQHGAWEQLPTLAAQPARSRPVSRG